jgi:GT2 family glycosyltransferase
MTDLSITVVSYNTRELLRECLESVKNYNSKSSIEIIVVDNASHDGSPEMVKNEFPQVKLIANTENYGFAKANNQSWEFVKGKYWLLLNSDAVVRKGALDILVAFMDKHPQAGLATARVVSTDGSPQHCAQRVPSIWKSLFEFSRIHKLLPKSMTGKFLLGNYWSYDKPIEVGWAWGTALIARGKAVEEAGLLSEDFFMYGEDLEWCLRMKKHGWQIWFCNEAEVMHYGGQSSALVWDEKGKQARIIKTVYEAIKIHRGKIYLKLLQLVTLGILSGEWLISKVLRKNSSKGFRAMMNYHLALLKGQQ